LNEAYKKGNRRAGCLICPRAAGRNDFMNHYCYEEAAEKLVDSIRNAYKKTYTSEKQLEQFIENGGWKARKNGRDLDIPLSYKETTNKNHETFITVENPKTNWKEWIKSIGILANDSSPYSINFKGDVLSFELIDKDGVITVYVDSETGKKSPEFVKLLKNVFRKTACCVACRECQADCPYGILKFVDGKPVIGDDCHHCSQCHKVDKGCLVYKSLEKPKGGIIMAGKNMSLNSYSHHAPKMDWIRQYFEYKNDFDANHTLGSQMYSFFKRFLRDAKLLDGEGFSSTAEIVDKLGYESNTAWGIIFVNLCYSPQINWYVNNVGFGEYYTKQQLATLMLEAGAKENWTNDIFSSLSRLSELPLGCIGFGQVDKTDKKNPSIRRTVWFDPSSEVILYALYKFAENCGDYYQFSLETLLDSTIERDGVSPSLIFGLDKDTMIRILNGLSINYPEYISASFTLDLDNITLRNDKSSADVLTLL
jgi:phosphoadenosine phosphosulfate reductase